ncbi:hypothetical protein GCM10025867_43240 [Frondihabitans sucicola]|uniref:F5/8 type C domain-containing protein n=1 Tax=Frondihabitans sucicola TaxID=1268041 RepID=A0ABN6Y7X8_9MICO|nr:discoidin domain-containing protein [Frondihabitans sucicola]BDZ52083.1 hypothetical protein GCM10025867_43240 [Frondihabitans sucicola]
MSKPGFTKFAWQPEHDDWLLNIGGTTPVFLPSTTQAVQNRYAETYSQLRDGFDASASLFATNSGYAGMTTLPTGTVVYATSGTAAGEGRLTVNNLTMPGVPGLDGDRSYTSAEGTKTLEAADTAPATPPPAGVTRVDKLTFPATTARHVRMLGVTGQPTYGYSLFELEAGSGTANAALGKPVTASSADPAYPAAKVTDGDYTTRWAVSRADRTRGDSSVAVDLGAPTQLDHVDLYWEASAGSAYRVQTSLDGVTWTDVASYGLDGVDSTGNWLSIDGEAGLVVRGSTNPITVRADQVVLSDGPASGSAGMVVEGYAGADAKATKRLADRPGVVTSQKALAASDADGYLSLFNLSGDPVAGTVQVPKRGDSLALYPGTQTATASGVTYAASVPAAGAAVEPTRFTVSARHGGGVPAGLVFRVEDAQHLTVTAPKGVRPVDLNIAQVGTRTTLHVTASPGRTSQVSTRSGEAYPIADLALGRTTFPTSPLPAGMSDPGFAVDGNDSTVWTPGSTGASNAHGDSSASGRMVVDLGSPQRVASVATKWSGGTPRDVTVSVSSDGLTYTPVNGTDRGHHGGGDGASDVGVHAVTRYVAVTVSGGTRHSGLETLTVRPE